MNNISFERFDETQKEEVEVLLSMFPDRIFMANSSDDDNNETQPDLRFVVPLKIENSEKSRVRIEVWLGAPAQEQETTTASSNFSSVTEKLPVAKRPSFERTVSGRRWYSAFSTNEPVHLQLFVVLSKNYPSRSAPDFSVKSPWLTGRQLTCICEKLDSIWTENEGNPILCLWLDWLENDSLNYLGVSSINLSSADQSNVEDFDSRVINEHISAEERLMEILKFDMQAEIRMFNSSMQTCPICMDEKLGEYFYRLENCWHICCSECLRAYVEMHVQQGTIQYLSCPNEKCNLPIPVNALRQFLSAEQWRRFDELSLSKAIESIKDLDWCPRCQMPCERELDHDASHLARCPYCSFSFCTSCREVWHQGVPCKSLEDKLGELEQSSSSMSYDTDVTMSKPYRLKLYILSAITMNTTTKRCPGCTARIEKDGGCNKVICTSCGTIMCFLCGQKIKGYQHFEGSCRQFTQDIVQPPLNPIALDITLKQTEMETLLELQPNMRRKMVLCPNCKMRNIKMDQNNHIRCLACRGSFCYLCGQQIIGPLHKHFNSTKKCKQHSED